MEVISSVLKSRAFPWVLLTIILFGGGYFSKWLSDENDKIKTYNRQLKGQLTEKEKELQQLNTDLGLSASELVTQKELAKRIKEDKEELDKKFEAFKKKHDLEIVSRDKTIASLKQEVKNGNTNVTIVNPDNLNCDNANKCAISYVWSDPHNRFNLNDPNIWEKKNEIFESKQVFKIYGEVYEQEDGSLQTRRLVLREVVQDEKGNYVPIEGGKANIIESKFEYDNPPKLDLEKSWKDLFKLRLIAVGSVTAFPDSGATKFGLGLEFFNWEGLGVNTHTAFDFQEAENTELRLGLSYSPTVFDQKLNLGLGVSAGTPFGNFFNEVSTNIDLIFYVW